MSQKQINIIISWVIVGLGIGACLYTNNFFIGFFMIILAAPLRKDLYTDESIYVLFEEYPKISRIAVFISLVWLATIAYRINTNELKYKAFNEIEIFLLMLPILFLYLHRDLRLFLELKKQYRSKGSE